MKISLNCMPCFVRQALEAARQVSDDPAVHEKILREVLYCVVDLDLNQSAPVVGQRIHRRLRRIIGVADPYQEVKAHQNRMVLKFLPELHDMVEAAEDSLTMALRLSIAANIIDVGVGVNLTETRLREHLRHALADPFVGDVNGFYKTLSSAQRILYLTDNAGEIAVDRLLIEKLSPERVTVAVRGAPVINDATLSDAELVGLDEIVEIIDNGSDAPGTLLEDCSPAFKDCFGNADLIIAKGQGNFESLSDEPYPIVFLFQAKCSVIADHAGTQVGTHVLTWPRKELKNFEKSGARQNADL